QLDRSGHVRLLAHGAELASAALARAADNIGGVAAGPLGPSHNGNKNGMPWATAPVDANRNTDLVGGGQTSFAAPGFSWADPARMRLIWQQAGFTYSKFCPPVAVDGMVLVPTYDGRVDVYRLN